jgi:hypothetical protein
VSSECPSRLDPQLLLRVGFESHPGILDRNWVAMSLSGAWHIVKNSLYPLSGVSPWLGWHGNDLRAALPRVNPHVGKRPEWRLMLSILTTGKL